jgi:hypothetical protein
MEMGSASANLAVSLPLSEVTEKNAPKGPAARARHVATLAGLKASGTNYTTSSENHKSASGQVSAAFP